MRKRWLVVLVWVDEWEIHDRAWTRWGVERKARRVVRRGPFPYMPVDMTGLARAVTYCHEDEFSELPDLPLAASKQEDDTDV